jgi:hypothetical protein
MTAELQPVAPPDPEAPLRELAAKYPEPDVHEWAADRQWLAEQMFRGALDAHRGKVLAAYNKQVIGVGDHYVRLLLELSAKYNVSPFRFAVAALEDEFA